MSDILTCLCCSDVTTQGEWALAPLFHYIEQYIVVFQYIVENIIAKY